ncbi:MAG: hypothetical protein ACLPZR_14820 [Solirubrobacteraceae bacterium]
MGSFEDAVWRQLVDQHAADCVQIPARQEQFVLRPFVGAVGTGVVVAAVAAAVLVLVLVMGGFTNSQPAYALTQNPDGSVTVSLTEISTGIPALNAEFAKLGIRETVIPIEATCTGQAPGALSAGLTSMTQKVTVSNRWIPNGQLGYLAAEQLPDGKVLLASGTTAPPVPTCFPRVEGQGFAPASQGS